VGDERGDVRGEEGLALADADHQRRVPPRAHHHVRLVGVHRDQRERALQPPAHQSHRLGEIRAGGELLGEQMRDDLGVRLGGQLVAALRQLGPQQGEVLDDAVVHHRDPPRVVDVRVGVGVRRAAVRGPAGVPDARRAGRQRPAVQLLLQVEELAGLLRRRQPAVGQDGDARRVVAPVLQPLQPGHHDLERGLRPHVSHDSTHGRQLRVDSRTEPAKACPKSEIPTGVRSPEPGRLGRVPPEQ
jgi:hypothetical protein